MLVTVSVAADTIKLKDGSILKGKVVSYSQRKFTIMVYIGGNSTQYVIPVEDVESVEFDVSEVAAAVPKVATEAAAPARVEAAPAAEPLKEAAPAAAAAPPVTDESRGGGTLVAEKTVSVPAAADWTSTEIRVQRGQRIVISASGEVDLGDNQRTGPDGINTADSRKLLPGKATGGLIAVVGDDNDDFIFIGSNSEFVAPHNGILFLSVNEGNLKDNNGAFVARVRILSLK